MKANSRKFGEFRILAEIMNHKTMNKSIVIENILSQVKQLDYDTRVYLMERLSQLLKRNTKKTKHKSVRLTELNCLGTEIWEKVNIDQYVQQERQWD